MKIKRALLSVWDKDGIIDLARFLSSQNIEILSTGGTKKIIEDNGLDVTSISHLTGSGSVMDGRVKTLHPKVFGGILADRSNMNHIDDLEQLHGLEIDLVVVNFYPFVKEAVKKKLSLKKAIEFIDIGGPSMIRAAAKNYHSVVPLCDKRFYSEFIESFKRSDGNIPVSFRERMAISVFSLTSNYEKDIFNYFNNDDTGDEIPKKININLEKSIDLRYGENPHQKAAFYTESNKKPNWVQHQGKELSYNNFTDMESAYSIVQEFKAPSCSIIKHANPCGFGTDKSLKKAFERAVSADPVSYFGGIVGFNKTVDAEVAVELEKPFLECIIAPSFSKESMDILKSKKNLRLISIGSADPNIISIKSVAGGYLFQNKDFNCFDFKNIKIVTDEKPTKIDLQSMDLGWKLVRYVKSNAIVFSDKNQLLSVGAGQMSRIDSVKIAIKKVVDNGLNLRGSIMASDAFFPFSDCVELAAEVGVAGIIQPGGSIKDKDIIKTANKLGVVMGFTGLRHFFH